MVTHQEPDILELWSQVGLKKNCYKQISGGDEIPAELFQILKDDAMKVLHSICQQIWKTQQWSDDWKRSGFIPIPKKRSAKERSNFQTLCSFHMQARLYSKSFKLGFGSTWTENFQMYKLALERVRNQRSNCQHLLDHRESKGIPEKHLLMLLDYAKAFDCVDHNKLCKILTVMGIPDHLSCLQTNLYAGEEAIVRTSHGTMGCIKIGKGIWQGCLSWPCLFT